MKRFLVRLFVVVIAPFVSMVRWSNHFALFVMVRMRHPFDGQKQRELYGRLRFGQLDRKQRHGHPLSRAEKRERVAVRRFGNAHLADVSVEVQKQRIDAAAAKRQRRANRRGSATIDGVMMVALLLILAAFAGYSFMQWRVERACLRAGYPASSFRMIGSSYCMRRVDQTDQVVPLDSIEGVR
jgi:hypothetical protein